LSDCEGSEGVRTAAAQAARARAAARRGEQQAGNGGAAGGVFDPTVGTPSRLGRGGEDFGSKVALGSRGGDGVPRPAMAVSMGLSNVAYYDSENGRGISGHGLTRQVRQLLLSMRNRNHKLAEEMTQFESPLLLNVLVQVLGRTLSSMGGEVTLQRNTRRKLKYRTVFAHRQDFCGQWTAAYDGDGGGGTTLSPAAAEALALYAVVDVEGEDGLEGRVPQFKTVCLRRSREDPRRVSTAQFQSFFHAFHARFLESAAAHVGDEEHRVSSPALMPARPVGAGAGIGGGGGGGGGGEGPTKGARLSRRHRSRAAAASGVAAGVAALNGARVTEEPPYASRAVPLLSGK